MRAIDRRSASLHVVDGGGEDAARVEVDLPHEQVEEVTLLRKREQPPLARWWAAALIVAQRAGDDVFLVADSRLSDVAAAMRPANPCLEG